MRLLLGIAGFGTVCGLAVACGGESEKDPVRPDAMAGSPTTPVGGGGSGGSGVGGTNSATGGVVASGGTSPGPTQRCEGSFGASQTLFNFRQNVASSLSITADELELFYVDVASGADTHVMSLLKRSSKSAAFAEPTVVSELQATCAAENYPALDVSDDGLRMYFTCLDGPAPLRRATRASRSAAWVVDPDPIGTVGDSITVSGDELTAVGVRELVSNPRPDAYGRSTTAQPFGSGIAVAGVDESFMNPDLSYDGRVLFGVVRLTEGARISSVSLDDDFGATAAPSTVGMPTPPPGATIVDDYTPTLTPDCRSIYFLRSTGVSGSGSRQYTLEYAQR
jgi:hypothetical protein